MVSKKLIKAGKLTRAFNFLRRGINKESFALDEQAFIMRHYIFICYSLLCKFIDEVNRGPKDTEKELNPDPT